jgi:Mlc titration factor MtfA (ptsG expression regulator)|uniref:Zinc-dependent peptidase n=1 Tax=Desulfobacca acetoxidans TaxID=60893 RepID=A0A7V6A664_9BACT
MQPAYLLFIPAFVIGTLYVVWQLRREARRKNLRTLPIKPEWINILEKNVKIYRRLPASLKEELHGHIQVFLQEKNFEGCGGLELTDEIKVTIAAQACLLLLNRKTNYYPGLSSIVIYPSTYIVKNDHLEEGVVIPAEMRLGESWRTGVVVLAWDEVLSGALNPTDGANVVFHEFAHQLDQENGEADGTPLLENRSQYLEWGRVLSKEFTLLQKKSLKHVRTVMNYYGATDPSEFFAVATETFFEKSREMKAAHPELYEELKSYYKVDPLTWASPADNEDLNHKSFI